MLSFCFRIKAMKQAFVTFHSAVKKAIAFDGMPFQQL
jgi:hypothetical protein